MDIHAEKHALLLEARSLKVELLGDTLPGFTPSYQAALADVLRGLEDILAKDKLDSEELGRYAFSIFRIVTDGWDMQRSKTGQKLLQLSTKIEHLSKRV